MLTADALSSSPDDTVESDMRPLPKSHRRADQPCPQRWFAGRGPTPRGRLPRWDLGLGICLL